jgi:integrase
MHTMPRPRPPYLLRQTTRHGKSVWYVRIGKGPRIRLHAEFGTTEFMAEYEAAIAGKSRKSRDAAAGTLAWLVARYRETAEWQQGLSLTTRRQRDRIFAQVLDSAGDSSVGWITTETIAAGYERRANTPAQARHFPDTMRGLFQWAAKAKLVKTDPARGVERVARKKTDGFIPWTEEHVAAYEARWPIGTRQRVWLDVLLYTGLRRSDAVRFGRQHVRNGVGKLKTEKTKTAVTLPILSVLAETLAAGPCGDLTFIAGENRQPFTRGGFGNAFREACRAAGVPGSAHGVRKIAATRAANAGATVAELEAIFGWTGGRMASHYTQSADRERLALRAMHKLANETETSIPSPRGQVRAPEQK